MNKKRFLTSLLDDWLWKIIFAILFSVFILAFSYTASWQKDTFTRINHTNKLMKEDLYMIRINYFPEFFDLKVEDNKDKVSELQGEVN